MDYMTCFDIQLEKDVYYRGENVVGCVLVENREPLQIRGIRCFLRGRVKINWKVLKSGETRILKDNQYLIDERQQIFGRESTADADEEIQILPRGAHRFNFTFPLPASQQMPCSLETRYGTVRYYVKVIVHLAYASPSQGIKYFTFIGPHIDCMDEKYLASMSGQDHKVQCLRCWQRGTVALRIVLERTAYCCDEPIRLRAHVENRQDMSICLCIRLMQHIEYRIERANVSETKSVVSTALEYRTQTVRDNASAKFDSSKFESPIRVPVIPPTMIGVCRLMQIYYVLKVSVEDERKNETLEMDFPLTIGTVPHRSAQSQLYTVAYDFCVDYVESGKYVSPEFRLGNICDEEGGPVTATHNGEDEEIILYRPMYVKIVDPAIGSNIVRRTLKYNRDAGEMSESAGSLFGVHTGVNGSAASLAHIHELANVSATSAIERSRMLRGDSADGEMTAPETVTFGQLPNLGKIGEEI